MKMSRLDRPLVMTREDKIIDRASCKGNQEKYHTKSKFVKYDYMGQEGLAETVISDLLGFSSLNKLEFAKYEFCEIEDKDLGKTYTGCVSDNFLKEHEHIMTFYDLFRSINLDKLFSNKTPLERFNILCEQFKNLYDVDVSDYLRKCITIDAVFLNEDRHYNNLCVIYDSEKDRIKPCVIFDQGLGLWADTMYMMDYVNGKDLSKLYNKIKARAVFSSSFEKQYRQICPEPPLTFDRAKVLAYLKENREVLGFRKYLIEMSMNKYPELFVESNLDLAAEETHFF